MNREDFIATLQACYFGDRNAFNEIVSLYDELNTRIDKVLKIIHIEKEKMSYAVYDSCLLLIEESLDRRKND